MVSRIFDIASAVGLISTVMKDSANPQKGRFGQGDPQERFFADCRSFPLLVPCYQGIRPLPSLEQCGRPFWPLRTLWGGLAVDVIITRREQGHWSAGHDSVGYAPPGIK
jgi:hypothetical protein